MDRGMDRSARGFSDPVAASSHADRRHSIRQKLNTPIYASFNGPQTGMVVDLSELLDLHEEGFSVQTGQRLEVNRAITVCLDLPETRNYIHCSGQVIWSDDAGRGGIRFARLPERSRQILKEWLFANLMIGCANHAARGEQRSRSEDANSLEPPASVQAPAIAPMSEGSAMLSAVEAVRLVVREIGDDLDKILQLVTERALSFSGASGAALAMVANGKMICRARAGETAPPLGSAVDIERGLSGECVRSGRTISCEDAENDTRVDPEVCRTLNIRSFIAAPIVCNLQVIGLLEIFSPHPRSFTKNHEVLLSRLVELIPHSLEENEAESRLDESRLDQYRDKLPEGLLRANSPEAVPAIAPQVASTQMASLEFASISATRDAFREPDAEAGGQALTQNSNNEESEHVPEPPPEASARLLYRALIGLAIAVAFVVIGYLVAPMIDKRWAVSPQASQRSTIAAAGGVSGQRDAEPGPQNKFLADLRKLADQGNADAQWQMGARYHNGEGVPRDDVQAMQWFGRAAEQGHVTAQATLGAYYWAGRGVPQDLSKAYFWSRLALAQGDENSKARLEGLATQMTREQVSAASQQAEDWIRSHGQRAKAVAN
jgi:putative methionine-R-sulfoxide reductase with GAF domain